MKYKAVLIIMMAATLLQGCIYVSETPKDGSGHYSSRIPTIGQELLDLDRARAAGAITGSEYDRAKAKILDELD